MRVIESLNYKGRKMDLTYKIGVRVVDAAALFR